jgi:hypothetical protein
MSIYKDLLKYEASMESFKPDGKTVIHWHNHCLATYLFDTHKLNLLHMAHIRHTNQALFNHILRADSSKFRPDYPKL